MLCRCEKKKFGETIYVHVGLLLDMQLNDVPMYQQRVIYVVKLRLENSALQSQK